MTCAYVLSSGPIEQLPQTVQDGNVHLDRKYSTHIFVRIVFSAKAISVQVLAHSEKEGGGFFDKQGGEAEKIQFCIIAKREPQSSKTESL